MLTLHELGHVLHAWTSGGEVVRLTIPAAGFSETVVHPNPRPLFVAWGGAVWGVAIPLLICGAAWAVWRRVPQVLRFFAGFCLIANGAYIGIGWAFDAGDAADVVALGAPVWVMILYGVICAAAGLWLWHKTHGIAGVASRNPTTDDVVKLESSSDS